MFYNLRSYVVENGGHECHVSKRVHAYLKGGIWYNSPFRSILSDHSKYMSFSEVDGDPNYRFYHVDPRWIWVCVHFLGFLGEGWSLEGEV